MTTENSTEILIRAIAILERAEAILNHIEVEYFSPQSEWVDKHAASKIVNKHWQTLNVWRRDKAKGLIEGIHWQHDGGEVVYHAEMLKDWYRHRRNPEAHLRTIEQSAKSQAKRRKPA
ncbi:hypothetical protein [Leptolyngbya sp. NIES-2104]|uniref:hypothetical protein n=1 Tax=Leptolyngbya sp. NIES-2104 TaxID=1552121 RepID=UPI0006ECA87E|nr:hypothetical protein [Leptolyngbya sp. NIES-2104]GAP99102.1 hypothetical protein NIES2104_56590 [Leptolyngbya sp. NIES-2104]